MRLHQHYKAINKHNRFDGGIIGYTIHFLIALIGFPTVTAKTISDKMKPEIYLKTVFHLPY